MLNHPQQNAWPTINTEFGYEHGPNGFGDKTYSVAQSPAEACRTWEVWMAGGFGAYYYNYTEWDIIHPETRRRDMRTSNTCENSSMAFDIGG